MHTLKWSFSLRICVISVVLYVYSIVCTQSGTYPPPLHAHVSVGRLLEMCVLQVTHRTACTGINGTEVEKPRLEILLPLQELLT